MSLLLKSVSIHRQQPSGRGWICLLTAVFALCSIVAARSADELPTGPLVVKAFMQWMVPNPRDPSSAVQRVYVRLENPSAQPADVLKLEGTFLDAAREPLYVDRPEAAPLAAGEKRELFLRFINPGQVPYIVCRVAVRYKLAGKTYERRCELTREEPSFPPGYVPGAD